MEADAGGERCANGREAHSGVPQANVAGRSCGRHGDDITVGKWHQVPAPAVRVIVPCETEGERLPARPMQHRTTRTPTPARRAAAATPPPAPHAPRRSPARAAAAPRPWPPPPAPRPIGPAAAPASPAPAPPALPPASAPPAETAPPRTLSPATPARSAPPRPRLPPASASPSRQSPPRTAQSMSAIDKKSAASLSIGGLWRSGARLTAIHCLCLPLCLPISQG